MNGRPESESRPPGVSSRLRQASGSRVYWKSPNGHHVELPAILDLVHFDEKSGRRTWCVEARVDLVKGKPRVTEVHVTDHNGLDLIRLQRFFRWATPLDVIQRTVPALLDAGIDPFQYEYPLDGYPDAADIKQKSNFRLSDTFLEDVSRQYLTIGRGYARKIANERGVSERTVVSWIEKARKRGILTRGRPGQFGGSIIPPEER